MISWFHWGLNAASEPWGEFLKTFAPLKSVCLTQISEAREKFIGDNFAPLKF